MRGPTCNGVRGKCEWACATFSNQHWLSARGSERDPIYTYGKVFKRMHPDDKLHIWPDFQRLHDIFTSSGEQNNKKERFTISLPTQASKLGVVCSIASRFNRIENKLNETDHYRFMWHLIKMFTIWAYDTFGVKYTVIFAQTHLPASRSSFQR